MNNIYEKIFFPPRYKLFWTAQVQTDTDMHYKQGKKKGKSTVKCK